MDAAAHHHAALWSLHPDEGKGLQRLRATTNALIFSRRLRASFVLKKSPDQATPVKYAVVREFILTMLCEFLFSGPRAAAFVEGGSKWGGVLSELLDFLVRVILAYLQTGVIASPIFAVAMVASMHLRVFHCALMIPIEVLAVLMGRVVLLVALPSAMAASLRDPRGFSCSLAGSWFSSVLPSDPIIVGNALNMAEAQQSTELWSLYALSYEFWQQFAGAFVYCLCVFHGAQTLGRFAGITLSAVGTTMGYHFELMNPAWGSVKGLLTCKPQGFWHKAAGALTGGIVAGLVYHTIDSEATEKQVYSPRDETKDAELDRPT